MSIVVILGICLAVLIGGVALVVNIVSALVQGITNSVGRFHRNIRYDVPEELKQSAYRTRFNTNWTDAETRALAAYRPYPNRVRAPLARPFVGILDKTSNSKPTSIIDIDAPTEVLAMHPVLPQHQLTEILKATVHYPVTEPTRPAPVERPPQWAEAQISVARPEFSPPYYSGLLGVLNGVVDVAHAEEQTKFLQACQRWEEIDEERRKRNENLKQLSRTAEKLCEDAEEEQISCYENALSEYTQDVQEYLQEANAEKNLAKSILSACEQAGEPGLLARIDFMIKSIKLPPLIPREHNASLDTETGVLILECRFPDPTSLEWTKRQTNRIGIIERKAATIKERKIASEQLFPALSLRLACEVCRLDDNQTIKAVAINGWVEYVDKANGQKRVAYCTSLFAKKEALLNIKLSDVDPVAAFNRLKGISAPAAEIVPISPIVRMNTDDRRFVDSREIIATLADGENLAAMDWEDFEHLCRELFERAFAGVGAEVRVTQASRDQGVDAIIFDPDPLRGGKIVVQAKRYTNVVDVSAVRDLYGAVINEGANKGILVTTRRFGSESYSFAAGKPLTLLNGGELLGLLEKYGYKFRIDLEDARRRLAL